MKKTILLATMVACLLAMNVLAQKTKNNGICSPLTQTEAENFMNKNKAAKVTMAGGGFDVGVSTLMEGTMGITMASRKMKFDERMKLQEVGKKTKEEVVAYGALAVVVCPSSKVSDLTREQLEGISIDKTKSWKEAGGVDTRIVAYSCETSSGTYEFFKKNVLKNKSYVNNILSIPATDVIIQSISQTKRAIGYVGLAYLNKEVKPIHMSYDARKSYVGPSLKNARSRTYPIVRPLFYHYETKSVPKVRPSIDYVVSVEGRVTVKEVGYIPVR